MNNSDSTVVLNAYKPTDVYTGFSREGTHGTCNYFQSK